MKKKIYAIEILALAIQIATLSPSSNALTITDLRTDPTLRGANPTPAEIDEYIVTKCREYNFPPVVMRAIILRETRPSCRWCHFSWDSEYGVNNITYGEDVAGFGLGLAQITYSINSSGNFCGGDPCITSDALDDEIKLVTKSWRANIDRSFEILHDKWVRNSGTGEDGDPSIVENWYWAIARYNGGGIGAKGYVDGVYDSIRSYSSVIEQLEKTKNRDEVALRFGHHGSKIDCTQYASEGTDEGSVTLNEGPGTLKFLSAPYIIPGFKEAIGDSIPPTSVPAYTLAEIRSAMGPKWYLHKWNKDTNSYHQLHSGQPAVPVVFGDVHPFLWYAETIPQARCNGIIKGRADGLFHPDSNITFAEFFSIIKNAMGLSPVPCPAGSDWSCELYQIPKFAAAIQRIKEIRPDHGEPEDAILRDEAAAILVELVDLDPPSLPCHYMPYLDVEFEGPFCGQLLEAYFRGLMVGYPDKTFKPSAKINRAEAFKIIENMTKK